MCPSHKRGRRGHEQSVISTRMLGTSRSKHAAAIYRTGSSWVERFLQTSTEFDKLWTVSDSLQALFDKDGTVRQDNTNPEHREQIETDTLMFI